MIRASKKIISNNYSNNKIKHNINKPIVDYNQRGQFRSPLALKIGDKINEFEVIHRNKFADFEIDCAVFKCRKYGTEWIHFDCEEETNTLAMAIKCKQAPHIVKMALQKMLQCGSHKYPVRNPVQFMTRRSFNPQNFGYVSSDYIFHAYQTSLEHDHHNLMEVFLHMMFNPLLRQQDFKEYVWRYILKNDNKLEVQGEVANQLYQMMNYSETKIYDTIQKQLYRKKGIGQRSDITKLTYPDIVQWHKKIFNPTNLLLLSYGDMHPTKLINNFRKVTESFKWDQNNKINTFLEHQIKFEDEKQEKQQLQQSKTIKIQHLEYNVPLILSFKLQNLTPTERILLPILSYIIFDMPDSILMKWNTPKTPYPKHYGFQGNHFNLGLSFEQTDKPISDMQFLQQQKLIRDELQKLCQNKIPNIIIEQCLYHLESEYYSKDGMKIIQGCLENVIDLGSEALEQSFNVRRFISKLLKNYRKDNIFQQLIKKHILDNKKYIRIWGKTNPQLIEDIQFEQNLRLKLTLQKMAYPLLQQIRNYKPAQILQDYRVLPKININQFEIFEEKNPLVFKINNTPVYHVHKCDGIKIVIKYDITDIEEDQVKLIPIICETFPWMGANGITSQAFKNYISLYIRNINMNFQTMKTEQGMRLYLLFNIEFSDRNCQYGFNLCTNIINDFNHKNIQVISERLQRKATQTYNQLTENLIQTHGRHIGASRSPYAMMEDPIFMSRSVCSLAADILKISNPKNLLQQISHQLNKMNTKFKQKNRISVLFECNKEKLQKYEKYLEIILNPFKQNSNIIEAISDKDFTPSPCMKYFPNYNEEFVFEAFTVPYYQNLEQVPATMVLSSVINHNIKTYNQSGGCFLFKGSIISYLRGTRKKVLQLEDYYRKIEDIDEAKRFIFQKFRRYTAADLFYTGVSAEEARHFKQAVAMVDQKSVQACLQKHIIPTLKQGKSSILAIGAHLGNYQPLIKKGWTVQRSVEDMSLNMQSSNTSVPQIQMIKYLNIY